MPTRAVELKELPVEIKDKLFSDTRKKLPSEVSDNTINDIIETNLQTVKDFLVSQTT